jgi:hypothetical protein
MVLLASVDQVEDRFSVFGHSVNLDTRYVHGLRRMYQRFRNHLAQQMVLLRDVGQVETCFATIGSEIILDAPDCTPM